MTVTFAAARITCPVFKAGILSGACSRADLCYPRSNKADVYQERHRVGDGTTSRRGPSSTESCLENAGYVSHLSGQTAAFSREVQALCCSASTRRRGRVPIQMHKELSRSSDYRKLVEFWEVKPEKWRMKGSQQRDNSSVVPRERLESMDARSAEEYSGAVVSYMDGRWDSVCIIS